MVLRRRCSVRARSTFPSVPLKIGVRGHQVVVDSTLRDSTDRATRFALARFGPTVRRVAVRYARRRDGAIACTLRLELHPAGAVELERDGGTAESSLKECLRDAGYEVARELNARGRALAPPAE
jgi:hypothetical protein